METKNKGRKRVTTFDELIESRHGKIGTKKGLTLKSKPSPSPLEKSLRKEERRLASMTQDELAEKTGIKKSFISRIENGHSDIQLSTLFKLLELGLGRKISLTIE
jgi:DNA-binding XRE family transcriptional regulator